jgi:hypothetical protein
LDECSDGGSILVMNHSGEIGGMRNQFKSEEAFNTTDHSEDVGNTKYQCKSDEVDVGNTGVRKSLKFGKKTTDSSEDAVGNAKYQCKGREVCLVSENLGEHSQKGCVTKQLQMQDKELIIPNEMHIKFDVTGNRKIDEILQSQRTGDDQMVAKENLNKNLIKKLYEMAMTISQNQMSQVIIDSGATSHMFPIWNIFQTYEETSKNERYVTLGDENCKIPIVGEGKVNIIGHSLHVPKLKFGLISIPQLDKEGCTIKVVSKKMSILDKYKNVLLEANLLNNLYFLDEKYLKSMFRKSKYQESSVYLTEEENELKIDKKNYEIHHKLGHLSENKLKLALSKGLIDGIDIGPEEVRKAKLKFCYDCMRGKMKAFPRDGVTDHNWRLFEKVAVDYKGPFSVKSYHSYNGFFLFSDYYSDYVWVYLVKSKNEFLSALTEFYQCHVEKLKLQMQVLQGDYDMLHKDKEVKKFLKDKNGISLQLSSPYSHFQNGQIERDMQNVLDVSRTIMSAGNAPNRLWEFAVKHACLLINYSPTSNDSKKTPYELVFGKKPNVSRFFPFYAPGVYHVTKDERRGANILTNFKGIPCRFLGFDPDSPKNYLIYDVVKKRVITRLSCKFEKEYFRKTMADFEEQMKICEIDDEFLDVIDESEENSVFDEESVETAENLNNNSKKYRIIPKSKYLDISDYFTDENEGDFDENEDGNNYNPTYWEQIGADYTTAESSDSEIISEKSHLVLDSPYDVNMTHKMSDSYLGEWLLQVGEQLLNLSLPPVPKTIKEALDEKNPDYLKWYEAIEKELEILEEQGTFGGAEQFGRAMKTKFVFTTSFKPDFSIKYKARLVVCGYSQIYGVDYTETFAPTTPTMNSLILMHICKVRRGVLAAFDVKGAFLEGTNDMEQYCWLPEEILGGNKKVRVRIVKSLYGQKQSPKIWNDHLNNIMITMGMLRCPVSPCLYSGTKGSEYLYVSVHVDDGLIAGSSQDVVTNFIESFKTYLNEVTLFSPLKSYLGIQIEEDNEYVYLHQSEYIKKMDVYDIKDSFKSECIPMRPNINLRIQEQNPNLQPLLQVSGVLRYLSDRTRPDILTAVGEISSNGSPHPSDKHVEVSKNIIRYLKSTCDDKLVLGGKGPVILYAYSDASYITTGNCKSRLGGCVFLGTDSGCIYAFSRNDHTVSHSSCEAEIKAIDLTIKAILHIRDLLAFMGEEQKLQTVLYTDSKSGIDLLKTLKSNENTRHINLRINFIREILNYKQIELKFIEGEKNIADGLTKALDPSRFAKFKSKLMNLNPKLIER